MSSSGPLSKDDLTAIVDFDDRATPELREKLAELGGVEAVAKRLGVDLDVGLSDDGDSGGGVAHGKALSQAAHHLSLGHKTEHSVPDDPTTMSIADRKYIYGENMIPPPPTPLWKLIAEQFEDRMLQILVVAATIVFILGFVVPHDEDEKVDGWVDGLAIYLAVFIVVGVTAGNDWVKERKFQKAMLLEKDRPVNVLRNGKLVEISAYDVVVGDVVKISTGAQTPCDGIYIDGMVTPLDESALTGESDAVKKSPMAPFIFSGCLTSEGECRYLVTSVGVNSASGKITQLLQESDNGEATPLQEKLETMAAQVGYLGMVAGIFTFIGLTIRWGIDVGNQDEDFESRQLIDLLNFFIIGITIVVVAVPEGLPLAVTIAMAFSMLKMIKDNNFVRHLDASETMGEATAICSDKTGTLTENRMTVTDSHFCESDLAASGNKAVKALDETVLQHIAYGAIVNSNVTLGENNEVYGSKTEGALLMFARDSLNTPDYEAVRSKASIRRKYPFSSDRKMMSTLVETMVDDNDEDSAHSAPFHLYAKGASEIVLEKCTHIIQADGSLEELDEDDHERLGQVIDSFAERGLRTLSLAFRAVTEEEEEREAEDGDASSDDSGSGSSSSSTSLESDLILLGIVGIKDPVRGAVPDAVDQCHRAGIVVRMVTGDNIKTAMHIARECHILPQNASGDELKDLAMEGPAFRRLSPDLRTLAIPRLRVLARSSPEDKLILVRALREAGEVVAVTGDGTNDAPALKESDVGFAMGISGTDAAKSAADIILLDDNFTSIVSAIRWGRNVFDSIRKFLQFQLSVNIVAIIVTLVGSVITEQSPLNTVQLLWTNLIMDTLGALGLATDDPKDDILLRPPHRKTDGLLTRAMNLYIVFQVVSQCFVIFMVMFALPPAFGIEGSIMSDRDEYADEHLEILTLVFTVFILLQVFNEILARNLELEVNIFKDMFKNRLFWIIIAAIIVVQVLVVQFAGDFAGTKPLTFVEWLACILIAFCEVPMILIARFLARTQCNEKVFVQKKRLGRSSSAMSIQVVSPV